MVEIEDSLKLQDALEHLENILIYFFKEKSTLEQQTEDRQQTVYFVTQTLYTGYNEPS